MSTAVTVLAVPALLLAGAWLVAVLDRVAAGPRGAVAALSGSLLAPLHEAAALLAQQRTETEAPDPVAWRLAPALYLGLAAAGLALVPWAPGHAAAELEAGIVLWGTVETLTVVVVFLHGWGPNALLPLIGGYRYVATGLPIMLVSMFVLIAAALPAESLSVSAIVESQHSLWNVVRQPLGLPLFLLLGLSLALRGPLDYADSADLAAGTTAEVSGPPRLAWQLARSAMLVAFAAMASTIFLGGHLGPILPGPLWLLLKTAALLALLVVLGRRIARPPPGRMLAFIWTVLLPLAFIDLVWAGVVALP